MAIQARSTVHIVDDDNAARNALAFLVESVGWRSLSYPSAQDFLDSYVAAKPECLILDIRMPGIGGLELQQVLPGREIQLPIIILTGYADVATAVRAVKAGAVDLIEKPFNDRILCQRIEQSLAQDTNTWQKQLQQSNGAERMRLLTRRERQVMDLLVAGDRTKVIAAKLDISVRTAERHRARVMGKLQAKSLSDVVRIALME
jgi:two-component system response regulator FixJ